MESHFQQLASINVNDHVEKKNGLSYLSWTWAVDQLLRLDPEASWSYAEPKTYADTMMVFCTVRAFGKERTAQLPVMDHKHHAIPTPDAFQVNTAMQRALAKAIALHGLGLYLYSGEDLPLAEAGEPSDVGDRPAKVAHLQTAERRTDTITPGQVRYIQRLIEETGSELQKVLAYFRVDRLEDIAKSEASRVIHSLEQVRDRTKAAA